MHAMFALFDVTTLLFVCFSTTCRLVVCLDRRPYPLVYVGATRSSTAKDGENDILNCCLHVPSRFFITRRQNHVPITASWVRHSTDLTRDIFEPPYLDTR